VASLNLKDVARAREEFQTAAKLEPGMAVAFQSLGVLEINQQDFAAAEPPLITASRLDPKDMKTLTLLAYSQALNKKYEDAVAMARRVHEFPKHEGYAFAHMVAATALQSSGDAAGAIKEYKQFIAEDPQNPRVPLAKHAIEQLEAGGAKAGEAKPR